MINAISNLQLNKLQGIVKPYAPAPVKTASLKAEKAAVKNNDGITVAECARLLNTAKAKNIPSQNKIFNAFYSGKLDPRKLGNIVRKYKDGELHIRVVKNPETGKKIV